MTSSTVELSELSAWRARELIGRRELSPVELTTHVLSRIEAKDAELQTFATVDAGGALRQARLAERAQLEGTEVLALHGIPISVKENIPVAGFPTTGRGGRGGAIARDDWIGVERLRQAGAIVIGTNTMYPRDDLTRSARNPWDTSRVPGGSSSGSAASVAAGLVAISIASDGAGSIRLPAAFCGVVGLHPSRGRVPHVDYVNPSLPLTLTIGPIARDVRDAAITLQVMAGPDGRDVACMEQEPDDYCALLHEGVDGLRLLWTDDFGYGALYAFEESRRVIDAVRAAAHSFESLGATVTSTKTVFVDPNPFFDAMTARLGIGMPGTVVDSTVTDAAFRAAIKARARAVEQFRGLLQHHDLLLSPTSHALAPTTAVWEAGLGDAAARRPYYCFTAMFNWIGWPALSLPCGLVDGLPIGLQLVAPPGREALLLRAAQTYQLHLHAGR